MAEFPGELRYAESHEWARVEEDGTIIVGKGISSWNDASKVFLGQISDKISSYKPTTTKDCCYWVIIHGIEE